MWFLFRCDTGSQSPNAAGIHGVSDRNLRYIPGDISSVDLQFQTNYLHQSLISSLTKTKSLWSLLYLPMFTQKTQTSPVCPKFSQLSNSWFPNLGYKKQKMTRSCYFHPNSLRHPKVSNGPRPIAAWPKEGRRGEGLELALAIPFGQLT